MTANNNVTEALQRTIGLMQGELEKSVLSTQLLGMSCFFTVEALSYHKFCSAKIPRLQHSVRLPRHTTFLIVSW